jgi:seryl-tRNA synthetase
MRSPWVGRTELDAALTREKTLSLIIEANTRDGERYRDLAAAQVVELKDEIKQLRADLMASEAKRELLTDRIVQLSGQPAIYQKRDTAEVRDRESEKPTAVPPMPERRASFDDVHRAVREAIKDGNYCAL